MLFKIRRVQNRVHNWFVATKSHKANHTGQLSFCRKFAPKVKKLNLVQKTVRNYPVIVRKLKPVRNTVRHCPVA